jgi:phosphoribosylformylglycinamidine synthase II
VITQKVVSEHGLSTDEYQVILDTLGREPTMPELGVFSVMWSEHCSYKSSRIHLARLPTTGPRVLVGPGENAGVVDLGDGVAACFKMESHNHPSYIEPYQGAATGMGGILRDVFTMGARPVALMDSLRFGRWDHPKTQSLVHGVVAGIAGYGNCMGIPNVGGETRFHPSYDGNCLVNAFCCGVIASDAIFLGTAAGVGNPVFYVGSRTGRDGIHGATMASDTFEEGDEEKRPTVQVGDPFYEKLLLEACLELMKGDCIVGIQDMGAAGLTSSSVEMAGRGGCGIHMELDKVPMRAEGMTPYEILLSESQERMLLVIHEGREDEVFRIFEKWDLTAARIGTVTDDGMWRCSWHDEDVAVIPVDVLTDAAPKYDRPQARPDWQDAVQQMPEIPEETDPSAALLRILSSENMCDKRWIFQQYDQQVGNDTVVKPGADAAVVRIKGTDKALAFVADCNGRHVYLDPFVGTAGQVVEAVRNLACVGAIPVGLTDCLNFGNPERPEIMWQFAQSVDGMAEACLAMDVPVVSGNVSLYNESDGCSILPTPGIAVVGLIEGDVRPMGPIIEAPGLELALLGAPGTWMGGSTYLSVIHGLERGTPPPVDYAAERALHDKVRALIRDGIAVAVHDLSDGGLAVALAEMAIGGVGGDYALPEGGDTLAQLFGEDHGRILVAYAPENRAAVGGVVLGVSGGDRLRIGPIELSLSAICAAWGSTFEEWVNG